MADPVAVGRREAALRRPSPVLGTSRYDRYGSAVAVLGSNEIVSLTPLSPIRGHQLGPTDKEICRILAHRDRLDALKEPAREGAHQRKDYHSGRSAHADRGEHGAEHHDKHDPGVVHAPGKEFRNCRRLHMG